MQPNVKWDRRASWQQRAKSEGPPVFLAPDSAGHMTQDDPPEQKGPLNAP